MKKAAGPRFAARPKNIPRFKAPKSIGLLKELPKNSAGDILKRALRDMEKKK
jgi:acyl-CoA synthetase (AMP-forming)/AMP-acid ligase II